METPGLVDDASTRNLRLTMEIAEPGVGYLPVKYW